MHHQLNLMKACLQIDWVVLDESLLAAQVLLLDVDFMYKLHGPGCGCPHAVHQSIHGELNMEEMNQILTCIEGLRAPQAQSGNARVACKLLSSGD
ncbi:unnamed protein product [Microthlaspi erraticum]|uniref:Uncharacterized protein n=1 Tax=Microthlaspi erraticum TaxID=1685480 RepID=A0A6D2HJ83_9BRAS|nr:unnamed protein product [Microthlaspi erraticum]